SAGSSSASSWVPSLARSCRASRRAAGSSPCCWGSWGRCSAGSSPRRCSTPTSTRSSSTSARGDSRSSARSSSCSSGRGSRAAIAPDGVGRTGGPLPRTARSPQGAGPSVRPPPAYCRGHPRGRASTLECMSSVAGTALPVVLPEGYALVEAPHPASLDDPDAWAYRAVADVAREIELETHGYDDLAVRPRDVLSGMDHQEYEAKRRFVVLRSAAARALAEDGARPAVHDVVAHLYVGRPLTSNEHLGEAYAFVRPAERGRGIGSALLDLGERLNLD